MNDNFELTIRDIAQALPYPPTPRVQRPQRTIVLMHPLRVAAMLVVLMGMVAFAVPDIRASVLEFLQLGAVTIYLDGTGESGEPLNLEAVSGETTLALAQEMVSFTLLIPPDDAPDRVFVQENNLVIMVWLEGNALDKALYQSTDADWYIIKTIENVQETRVGGEFALWLSIHHPVQFIHQGVTKTELTHFVDGNVLVWAQAGITMRLETKLTLEEATRFAESLRLIPIKEKPE